MGKTVEEILKTIKDNRSFDIQKTLDSAPGWLKRVFIDKKEKQE